MNYVYLCILDIVYRFWYSNFFSRQQKHAIFWLMLAFFGLTITENTKYDDEYDEKDNAKKLIAPNIEYRKY